MITPDELIERAGKKYPRFLSALIRGEAFFPLEFPAGAKPDDYENRLRLRDQWRAADRAVRGFGVRVEWETVQHRRYGQHEIPKRLWIESEADYLWLLRKSEEVTRFRADVARLLERLPQLADWAAVNPHKIVDQHGEWEAILAVCEYFIQHPRPNLYLRELPIPVHTKFIEQHTAILTPLLNLLLPADAVNVAHTQFERRFGLRDDETLVRFRWLDRQVQHAICVPFDDMSVPVSQFAALSVLPVLPTQSPIRCWIVENKMTFLTLPPSPNSLAVWGSGYKVLETLPGCDWLNNCQLFYWGDLDVQGFEILSALRAYFPHVQSVMMDWETFHTFAAFAGIGKPSPGKVSLNLTADEQRTYHYLRQHNVRLEQEHIPYTYSNSLIDTAHDVSSPTYGSDG